ncbi:MAG: ABC transporter permease subunit [Myxococcales bacterium]|nr:MAG: ABC transporter permease subunit [Myxococcales bacterium]
MSSELLLILWVSLKVACLSSIIVMTISLCLALLFDRKHNRWLKLLEMLIYIPMAMPPVALGYGLLLLVGPKSHLGAWLYKLNIEIAFNFWGAVLAASMASLGIGVRTMRTAFSHLDPHFSEIACLHGAHSWQIFRHIQLPLLSPSLAAGFLLVFIRSLGEFGATIFLAGNTLGETRTLALAIWTNMQIPGQEQNTNILVFLSITVCFSALFLSELLIKKSDRNF